MLNSLNIGGNFFDLSTPRVMAIVNVTDDSFYVGSRNIGVDQIRSTITKAIDEGADMIDFGGYSTRPNADDIDVFVERERVFRGVEILTQIAPQMAFSIDTFRSDVVSAVYDKFGAFLVNDVSGGTLDEAMFDVVAKLKLPYIMGHMRGTPKTMTKMTQYDDLIGDMLKYFVDKLGRLRGKGVVDVVLDPCFGFAKNIEQNFEILKNLNCFDVLELPILAGLSRKSMIYKTLNIEPLDSLVGTAMLNFVALENGAKMLRVHDVKEAIQTVKLFNAYEKAK